MMTDQLVMTDQFHSLVILDQTPKESFETWWEVELPAPSKLTIL